MDDCIFCKIVKGEISSYKIYEDEKVYAFLDIKPLSKGHTLLLPKEHYENILDIPKDLYGYMFEVAKEIAEHIQEKYNPEGIFINQNNGQMAGQSIMHVHLHIKPIYDESQKHSEEDKRMELSKEEMEKIKEDLKIS
jgi:histidine triad (HIT) family protein